MGNYISMIGKTDIHNDSKGTFISETTLNGLEEYISMGISITGAVNTQHYLSFVGSPELNCC